METNQINDTVETAAANNLNNNPVSLFGTSDSPLDLGGQTEALLNNTGISFGQMLGYLIAVVVVIVGLLFLRKYLLTRLGTVKNGSYMRVLDRLVISQDKQIVLVELKNKILLVGITQQRIEALAEIDRDDFDILEQDSANVGLKNSGAFVQMLSEKMKTNNKSDENDKK